MTHDPLSVLRDPARLAALRDAALLDSPAEEAFDRVTRLATRLLRAPIALVSLVDRERQFFKSHVGLPEPWASQRQTPLSHSFCQHTVVSGEPLVIENAREHPLVRHNGAIRDLSVIAYLGMPLTTVEGQVLGSLCVIDSVPRCWTDEEIEILRDLAATVMTEIELRLDIAERRHAEEALQKSEESIRALYRVASAQGLDVGEKVRALLQMGCERFGLPTGVLSHIEGDRYTVVESWPPDGPMRRGSIHSLQDLYCSNTIGDDAPVAIEHAGASEWSDHGCYAATRLEAYLGTPVRVQGRIHGTFCFSGPSPRPVRFSGSDRDFLQLMAQWVGGEIERARWEDALRAARDEMEQRVRERTAELARANQEQRRTLEALRDSQQQLLHSQKMEAVGRLAGGVAHDFNNLLTAIRGNAQMLLLDLPDDHSMREDAEEIDRAADRAATLTHQLLAFSRRQMLEPKVLDLNAIVRDVERMLRRLIGEDVELRTVLDPELGPIECDPGQVEQILLNLAVNARDAMPDGGRLTIETRNVEVDEAYARRNTGTQPGPYGMLSVSDTGCGMDREVQERVWEPFFTTKEPGKGTGLGLSTVYGIVQQSGGSIEVRSEPGCGTVFEVCLPRVDHAPPEGRTREPAASPGGSETVLLVEDEAAVRLLARRILERNGYTVLDAPNGAAALELCGGYPGSIDLVVSDMVMPGMSGREVVDRATGARPGMRVLFISGYTDGAMAHPGLADSGGAFLQKPFTPDGFARKVREVLDGE